MSKELIEKIINSKKIKYEVLDELMRDYLNPKDHQYKDMNIFIDIDTVLRQFYSENMTQSFTSIKNKDRMSIAPEIINMIAHYRHYFASRKRMYTRFILFYSNDPSSYHTNIDPEYKSNHYGRKSKDNKVFSVINNVINYIMDIVNNIVRYIPNAYVINTGKVDPMVIPHFILNNSNGMIKEDSFNMIMTNNKVYWQELLYNDNTFIMELRNDKSRLVTSENIMEVLLDKTKKIPSDFPNIDYNSIDIINLFLSNTYIEMKSIKGYGPVKIMKKLDSLVKEGKYIPYRNYSSEDISDMFEDNISDQIKERYRLLNTKEVTYNNYKNILDIVLSQWIHIDDPKAVKELNDDIFIQNPLILDFLYEGENK